MNSIQIKTIAHIRTDFPTKFGLPRQSRIVSDLHGTIIFDPEYRNSDSLREIDGFSHLWLIWGFSESFASNHGNKSGWNPTVRPPRLGGNRKVGVFATRSPNRPNPIGLSCVKLDSVEIDTNHGPIIHVSGIDMVDMTPIFDIKPYLPHADCISDAVGGFSSDVLEKKLNVSVPPQLTVSVPPDKLAVLIRILEEDPRPSYQDDPERIYGFEFAGYEIGFRVEGADLTVLSIIIKK